MQATLPTTQDVFTQVEQRLGFVPHLIKEMSVSLPTLLVYLNGQDILAKGTLTPKEQQAVQLAVSSANSCHYCQAVHDFFGHQVGIPAEEIKAIRAGRPLADPRLAAVVETTKLLVEKRGWLSEGEQRTLAEQGLTKAALYEIIAYIGLKTITNYINHIAHTPVDAQFSA